MTTNPPTSSQASICISASGRRLILKPFFLNHPSTPCKDHRSHLTAWLQISWHHSRGICNPGYLTISLLWPQVQPAFVQEQPMLDAAPERCETRCRTLQTSTGKKSMLKFCHSCRWCLTRRTLGPDVAEEPPCFNHQQLDDTRS